MENNELYHHGIIGMKWGVRRYQNKDGTLTAEGKRHLKNNSNDTSRSNNERSSSGINRMSDSELRERISRLELEKKYKELSSGSKNKTSHGKSFVMDVLEKSGKNVATQMTTYVMGKSVNKLFRNIFGEDIVNPKKGQKDK